MSLADHDGERPGPDPHDPGRRLPAGPFAVGRYRRSRPEDFEYAWEECAWEECAIRLYAL
ncbi:hypothetical protein AB0G15_30440 [Streptosporangium sp. NPDC023825]|uniref:hypothetical protein n=1 Tax=Streptosporangium sp. NPDC023825 TaxID=3154909 RepID=UPI003439EC1E